MKEPKRLYDKSWRERGDPMPPPVPAPAPASRCRIVPAGDRWNCVAAGCGASGKYESGWLVDAQGRSIRRTEATPPHTCVAGESCLFDADPHPNPVDDLFDLCDHAGATVTLHGRPTSRAEVKRVALERSASAVAEHAAERLEVCSICGARNVKHDAASYTEAHRAREHRVHDRLLALEERVVALESRGSR